MSAQHYTIYEPIVYSATASNRYKAILNGTTPGTLVVERQGDGVTMSIGMGKNQLLPISTEKCISGPVGLIGLN